MMPPPKTMVFMTPPWPRRTSRRATLAKQSAFRQPWRMLIGARVLAMVPRNMASNSIEIRPISGALGAEIHGVDVSHDLSDHTVADIRRAFLDHLVIFFRDQDVTSKQFLAFARR